MILAITSYGFPLLALLLVYLLFRGISLKQHQGSKLSIKVLTVIVLWSALSSILSASGFFMDFDAAPPRVAFLLGPGLISLVVITLHRRFGNFVKRFPATWLVYPQVFRVIVEFQLWALHKENVLPYQLTFEGWNFDIFVGISAPLVGYFVYHKRRIPLWVGALWNGAGIAILMTVVVTAVLSFPTPFQVFTNEPSNIIVAQFPVIFLPAVLVPFALGMHFFMLRWHREQGKS